MPRRQIPLLSGEVYHIYNRGVDRRKIFNNKNDYLRFYQSLYFFNTADPVTNFDHARVQYENSIEQKLVCIHAYSLLPNHFHLILEQLADSGISEFIKRISGGYTAYFNNKHERSGVLFQGKYKRTHVDSEEKYNYLFAYVNENHHVHGIQRNNDVCYSSSVHFQGKIQSKAVSLKKDYSVTEAQRLALEIYSHRNEEKYLLES